MFKIIFQKDLQNIPDPVIAPHIIEHFQYLITTYKDYCSDHSIQALGMIVLIESEDDLKRYQEWELGAPIADRDFEWFFHLENDYFEGCVVLDNDRAIHLIGKEKYFRSIIGE